MRVDHDSRGVIGILAAAQLVLKPRLHAPFGPVSTFAWTGRAQALSYWAGDAVRTSSGTRVTAMSSLFTAYATYRWSCQTTLFG